MTIAHQIWYNYSPNSILEQFEKALERGISRHGTKFVYQRLNFEKSKRLPKYNIIKHWNGEQNMLKEIESKKKFTEYYKLNLLAIEVETFNHDCTLIPSNKNKRRPRL